MVARYGVLYLWSGGAGMTNDVMLHFYIVVIALVVALVFGTVWALVPLTVGVALVLAAMLADAIVASEVARVRRQRID